ncbi:hypothetical protein NHX12_022854, partial [Muraenolepis orangiensis]
VTTSPVTVPADGFYQITGRMDDVINFSGHRLGEVPFAFLVLKEDVSQEQGVVVEELRRLVATKIAKYAIPDHFLVVKRLPKTRSGKILRRILGKVALEQTGDLGDVSTLDDPSVVSEIVQAHQRYREQQKTHQEELLRRESERGQETHSSCLHRSTRNTGETIV